MQTNLEKIKNAVRSSSLAESDKNDLLAIFEKANEKDLLEIAELIENDPAIIPKLSDNLKIKRVVVRTKNSNLWKSILKEEESELEGLNH